MSSPVETPEQRPRHPFWKRVRYLLISAIICYAADAGLAAFSKGTVVELNKEVITALNSFNFPSVVGAGISECCIADVPALHPEFGRPPSLGADRKFSWLKLIFSPLLGFQLFLAVLGDAWRIGWLAFLTTSMALSIGGLLVWRLLRSKKSPGGYFEFLVSAWLAPFAGGLVLWALQAISVLPFVLFGKAIAEIQGATVLALESPALIAVVESVKSDAEHRITHKVERHLFKESEM